MADTIAWVLPGGGAQAVYTAGACVAAHEMGLPEPDIIVTASGSCGSAFYFVSHQFGSFETIWCELLSSKQFTNPLRFWKIGDIDYLVDVVCKKLEPLNMSAVYASSITVLVALTNAETGEVVFRSNKDGADLWEVMRATKSSVIFSGLFKRKTVTIDGAPYFDTRVSSRPSASIQKAIDEGANKIIVFDNYHPESNILNGEILSKLWLLTCPKKFRKTQLRYYHAFKQMHTPEGVRILLVSPQAPLAIEAWNNSKKKLRDTFEQARRETRARVDILNFINE